MSAAEMLMMFHFYFLGNPEGLVFDVLNEPFSDALWKPMERYLESRGVELRLSTPVSEVRRSPQGRWEVVGEGEEAVEGDALVLAVTVPALQTMLAASPDLRHDPDFVRSIESLGVTLPFAVWRLFYDRPAAPERPPFAGTTGFGHLDNISLYERFEGESRRWSLRTGGSVVELHGYALPEHEDEGSVKADLEAQLMAVYPELQGARVLHESFLLRRDCPSFGPGSHAARPRVATPYGNVALAGDFVKLPFPTALMERATSSGLLAANHLLDRWDVRGDTVYSVPRRGYLASLSS